MKSTRIAFSFRTLCEEHEGFVRESRLRSMAVSAVKEVDRKEARFKDTEADDVSCFSLSKLAFQLHSCCSFSDAVFSS